MIRRVVGFAHVVDLEGIEDEGARAGAERLAIALGRSLILAEGLKDFRAIEGVAKQHL